METKKRYNSTLILSGILSIVFLLLWFKGCSSLTPSTVKVKTPEVKGSFKDLKPKNEIIKWPKNGQKNDKNGFVLSDNTNKTRKANGQENQFLQSEIDRLLNEYNSLNDAFARANDSLQQEIYKRTIAPKLFSQYFDNDTLSATVKGIVANGEVQKLKLDYTIKSRNIDVKVPEVKFRLLGGVEVGATKEFDKFNTKVNLGFQNKKGDIISVSADTDQRFYLGYSKTIFSIKK
jgi:hypothetical protein